MQVAPQDQYDIYNAMPNHTLAYHVPTIPLRPQPDPFCLHKYLRIAMGLQTDQQSCARLGN